MTRSDPRPRPLIALAAIAVVLSVACSGDGPAQPEQPPEITITGVEEGVSYTGAVSIGITIDRGTYTATLNGEPFHSGGSVSAPGEHVLSVTARAGVVSTTTTVSFTIAAPPGGTLIIRILDLGANDAGGGGDAILVTDSSAAGLVHAMIDAGPAGANASDAGYVARRLRQLGVDTLAFMLLTHAHSDHFQGMSDVLNQLKVRRFYYNGQVRNLSFYTSLLSLARARADTVIVPTDTATLAFGTSAVQSRFTLVPPLPTWINNAGATSDQMNEGSLGALLRRGTFEMFFTGDGEVAANNRWRTQFAGLTRDIDVLKVGHHGANNAIFDDGFGSSRTSSWLTHTNPRVGVISANGVTHPRVRAVSRLLQQSSMRTYCTNVHGDIEIRVWSDASFHVDVQRAADADCVPGSQATT